MKRYIVSDTGIEVVVGGTLAVGSTLCRLSEENISHLVALGILKEKLSREKSLNKPEEEYYCYTCNIADRIGWDVWNVRKYLEKLCCISQAAVANILLMEVAKALDGKYSDNIRNAEEIYTIDYGIGRISQIKKECIEMYEFVPAFRTIKDVKIAVDIMKSILYYLDGKQRSK